MCNARVQLNRSRLANRGERGYTLPEVLVATVISLITIGAVLSFNRAQLFALRDQSSQLDVQTIGRNFTDLFTREVRRAGMDPTCSKSFEAIASARPDQIEIKSDLNGNGAIDATGEDVIYTYNPAIGNVERTSGGVTDVILSGVNVSGSTLRYYDGAGAELLPSGSPPALTATQRTAVRRVQLVLTIQETGIDPHNPAAFAASFSSNVDLRNRFFIVSTACP